MKNFLIITIFFMTQFLTAQSTQPGQPWSLTEQMAELREVSFLPDVDVATLLEEDEWAGRNAPYRFGFEHILNEDFFINATQVNVENGQIYRQLFESPEALALRFVFYPFYLPDGVTMYAYNPDFSQIEGAYSSDNNHPSGYFSTPLITGDQIVLELNIPHGIPLDEIELGIEKIIHDYKGIMVQSNRDRACGINVMCEQADPYEDQINAVSWLDMGSYICSGAMINNAQQDLTPYYFTAAHCTNGNNPNIFRFYFNYYVHGCENGNSPNGAYAYSSVVRADCDCVTGSGDNININGPDFTLLEITDDIPDSWEVYYAGWNREDPNQMHISVGVHHPGGQPKKINFDTGYATSSYWSGTPHTHWYFNWDEGGTEGGSSGSPLYDDEGRIAGTLTGGAGECDEPGSTEYYGKVATAWDWGNSSSTRLKDWLDPNNSQITTIDGTYIPVSDVFPGDVTLDEFINVNDIILVVQFIRVPLNQSFPKMLRGI